MLDQTAPVDTREIAVHTQELHLNAQSSDLDAQALHRNTQATHLDAKVVHIRLRQALATLREAECNAVTLFAEIFHRRLYRELGYAGIHIYASEALGFSRTKTYEFIRLAESLKKLPKLKADIETGKVPWTKARAIVQIATPQSEQQWIEIAQSSSRRELEQQVIRSKALRDSRKRNRGQGELLAEHAADNSASGRGEANAIAKPAPPEAAPVQSVTIRMGPLQRARFDAMIEKLMKHHNCSKSEVVLMALEVFLRSGERSIQDEKSTRVDSVIPYQVIVYQCETCTASAVRPE